MSVCEADETEIYSPWMYSSSVSCGELRGAVPDFYNEVYRSECQRQLGLHVQPPSVSNADIGLCYGLNNGTTKYQAKVCCPGSHRHTPLYASNVPSAEI